MVSLGPGMLALITMDGYWCALIRGLWPHWIFDTVGLLRSNDVWCFQCFLCMGGSFDILRCYDLLFSTCQGRICTTSIILSQRLPFWFFSFLLFNSKLVSALRASTATSESQRALPDVTCKLQLSMGFAGPQIATGHCWTSAASSRSRWALKAKRVAPPPLRGIVGPQPRLAGGCSSK